MPNDSSHAIPRQPISGERSSPRKEQIPVPIALKLLRLGFRIGGRLLPDTAGKFAYKLWITPPRFKTPAREKDTLNTAKLTTHKIAGNDIVTFSWGEENPAAPLILLVHGWSGRGTQLGSFVPPLIEVGYRVLSFDAPAHGKSSGTQTNLYEFADVIVALQKHYGEIDSVITHSFGGPCLSTAMQHGFKTNRVVCICPPAKTKGLVEKFNSALQVPEKAAKKMMLQIEDTFGEDIWQKTSMVNTVKENRVPSLLIHDSNDSDIPWQEGEAVAHAWANTQFMRTSGLGHRRILRDDTVIDTAVAYINDNR